MKPMSVYAIREVERMRDSRAQRRRPMEPALLRGEAMIAGGYLVAALALLLLGDTGGLSAPTAAIYVAAIALAAQVRFDVGAGFTLPIQAIFVPMLFALPPAAVPILVPLALAIGMLPLVGRGEVSSSWLLTAVGNSWFALGPAFVLTVAGVHAPGSWGILVLALAAQFACDFAASAARERIFGGVGIVALASEVRSIYAIDLALSTLGLAIAYAAVGLGSQLAAILLLAPLFGVLGFFSRERQERLAHLAELNDAYKGTALLLGDVVEADDAYTGEHSKSVVRLSLGVCEQLGLDHDRRRNVEFAALLHDVGKIVVPNEIIQKPGELDEREWEIMRTHTIEGQRLLEKIGGFMSEVGVIVRASHEHWDGSGYPDGLSGEAIPLEARIVSACDAFNAMTTTRSYRAAMATGTAAAELERCAGSQFDPAVVAALLAVAEADGVGVPREAVGAGFRAPGPG